MDAKAPLSTFALLQPELMTRETLIEILHSKCVSMETMQLKTKDMLIDLYRRVALPLPQRSRFARDSGKAVGQKTSITPPKDEKGCSYTIGFTDTRNYSNSSHQNDKHTPANRLKPPPETQNSKKIRLSNSKNDGLENIVINERRKSQEQKTSSVDVDVKHVNSSKTITNIEDRKYAVEPKRVSLKRNFTTQGSDLSQTSDTSAEKKPKAKITWP